MVYRDDNEAALARADALQRELDRTTTELADTKAKLAEAERARDAPAAAPVAEPEPSTEPRAPIAAAVGVLALVGGLYAIASFGGRHKDPAPAPQTLDVSLPSADPIMEKVRAEPFTIASDPPGASVYALRFGYEQLLGTTPITKTLAGWALEDELELRLDGYKPVRFFGTLIPPSDEPNRSTIKLER